MYREFHYAISLSSSNWTTYFCMGDAYSPDKIINWDWISYKCWSNLASVISYPLYNWI